MIHYKRGRKTGKSHLCAFSKSSHKISCISKYLVLRPRSPKCPNLSFPFTFFRSEIDSELLDDKSEVLGVLAADNQGLCVLSQGEINKSLSQVVSSLAKIAAQLEPNNENVPTIVLESQSK